MAFRSDIYALILGALNEGSLHGYQIVRRIRETGAAGKLSEGQIYPYLHKLEEENFITAEWQTDTGAAPRRVYSLTELGLKELARHRSIFEKFVAGVSGILVIAPVKEGGSA